MDTLQTLVTSSNDYINGDISIIGYRLIVSAVANKMNDNEAKALADLITQYASHLVKGH